MQSIGFEGGADEVLHPASQSLGHRTPGDPEPFTDLLLTHLCGCLEVPHLERSHQRLSLFRRQLPIARIVLGDTGKPREFDRNPLPREDVQELLDSLSVVGPDLELPVIRGSDGVEDGRAERLDPLDDGDLGRPDRHVEDAAVQSDEFLDVRDSLLVLSDLHESLTVDTRDPEDGAEFAVRWDDALDPDGRRWKGVECLPPRNGLGRDDELGDDAHAVSILATVINSYVRVREIDGGRPHPDLAERTYDSAVQQPTLK